MDELELLDQLLKEKDYEKIKQLRGIASEPMRRTDPIVVQDTPLVEKPMYIQSDAIKNPSPVTEFLRKNGENLASDMGDSLEANQAREKAARDNYQKSYGNLTNTFNQMLSTPRKEYSEPEYITDKLKKAEDSLEAIKPPEQDFWSNAIISLGPSLLGLASGSAGMKAALPATQEARKNYDNQFNQSREIYLKSRENLANHYKNLLELRKDGRKEFNEEQDRDFKRAESLLKAGTDISKLDMDSIKGMTDQNEKATQALTKHLQETVKGMAASEQNIYNQGQAKDRAKIAASAAGDRAAQARQDRIDSKKRVTDKQVEALTDLDNAESDLKNILSMVANNTSWTGPVDGRIPDMLVSKDQAAWRSAVGKYKDAYRKAITGAGAGMQEVSRLESRLPSETDTYSNFKSKAEEALNELKRKRRIYTENLSKSGKDVSNFKKDSASDYPKTVRNGNKTAIVKDAKEEAEAKEEGFE